MRICRLLYLTLAVLPAWPASAASPPGVTLEQLLGSPFPTSLVAAPAGGRVAWVFNDRGRRNVWVAEPPDYKGRAITRYTEDDGQQITGLAWTPDGRRLCYVRGNGSHGGETLNPRSMPKGTDQAVWVVSVTEGAPH